MKMFQNLPDQMKSLLLSFALFAVPVALLQGCASPTMVTEGGCFHNMTGHPIEDLILRVLADQKEASCSYVGTGGYFSIQLPERTYMKKEIEITWMCRGKQFQKGPFVIPIPKPVPTEPAVVVVHIYPAGKAFAEFLPTSKVPLFNQR